MGGRRKKITLVVLVFFMAISVQSFAGYTKIYQPPAGEKGHIDIINDIYGGGFSSQGADLGHGIHIKYSNSSVTVHRINDFGIDTPVTNVLAHHIDNLLDKLWVDGIAVVNVQAKFAAYSQGFGYCLDGAYVALFDVGGNNFDVSGSAVVDFPVGAVWQWVRSGTGHTWYSDPANNTADGLDHMVTYRVDGLNDGCVTWLVFWEDLGGDYGQGSDRDFNDLVVEIKAAPEPVSFLLFVGGGFVLTAVNNRQRRRPSENNEGRGQLKIRRRRNNF